MLITKKINGISLWKTVESGWKLDGMPVSYFQTFSADKGKFGWLARLAGNMLNFVKQTNQQIQTRNSNVCYNILMNEKEGQAYKSTVLFSSFLLF